MLNSSAARGVVRAFALILSVAALDAGFASPLFAQGSAPAAPQSTFEAAWQNGTPITVTGKVTVIYADDFKSQ